MNITSPNFTSVLNVAIFSRKKKEILEKIKKYFREVKSESARPFIIFTPNPEIIVYAQKDECFRQIINCADVTLPDGIGLVWASRVLFGSQLQERIAGVDFMEDLCRLAAKKGLIVGLIGGRENVALLALECLKKKFPSLTGWAIDGPQIKVQSQNPAPSQVEGFKPCPEPGRGVQSLNISEKFCMSYEMMKDIVDAVVNRKTAILFVGLGYPKQEYFIDALSLRLVKRGYRQPIVLMAVGGAFDFLSGRIPRAPVWMRENGLEWFYRLFSQPWRVRRQMALVKFAFLVLRQYLKKVSPFSAF